MKSLAKFVSLHLEDDTTRLILNKGKWPETDVEMAVNCIESRRKLRGKVQEWYDIPELVFPNRISAEQCSSSATAGYKARLAERIATMVYDDARWKIADLTGGLGVDSWFFSQKADAVLYNEMQNTLCKAAEYNFGVLSANNITVVGNRIDSHNIHEVLDGFGPDIIYLDPARRSSSGKKVFLMGGGIGIPPMLQLAKEINAQKQIVVGYRNQDLFLQDDLSRNGEVYIATEDGSVGSKGNVMDAIRENGLQADVIMACGPMPMLRAIKKYAEENGIEAYISLEERMACGVGACLGCVCKTKEVDHHSHVNNARICTDGPVFEAKEVNI